jgi:hypothetical protein
MLSILSWKWEQPKGYRAEYTAEHVNILSAMLKRNLTIPYKLFCITDDPTGLGKDIEYMPLWSDPYVEVPPNKPNCYRRLKMYSRDAIRMFGERILSIDLDCVIVDNIDSLVDRKEDFVAWNKQGVPYQGGLILHKTGTRVFLWEDFDPAESPKLGKKMNFVGSDQAWVSAKLPAGEGIWTAERHGVLSYKSHIRNNAEYLETGKLPEGAKIIFYHGSPKPWETKDRFVIDHWRL